MKDIRAEKRLSALTDIFEKTGRKVNLTIFIFSAAVLAVFFLIVMAMDCNRFVVKRYKCKSRILRKDGRIILLSDLHNKAFGAGNARLLAAIDELAPDLILIAGDMYTSNEGGDTSVARDLVCTLSAKYPVYYGNGNHEHKTKLFPEQFGTMYTDYVKEIKKAGAHHLVNEKVYLPDFNMDLYGLEIGREYYGKFKNTRMDTAYLEKILGKPAESRFSVVIAHNPDYFKTYAKWGADLVVSGHVHGGLMRLPVLGGVISPAIKLFPKYDGGEYREGKAVMILGRGLGTHTLPIRIFNPGELVVIDFSRS